MKNKQNINRIIIPLIPFFFLTNLWAGLSSPVLDNPSFETPTLASGGGISGVTDWNNSGAYTYTKDEGGSTYPDTPYGDNWAELAENNWIYQQIGTYEEGMELNVTLEVGKRIDFYPYSYDSLPFEVSLWVGGNPALAADEEPLDPVVGATLIDSWLISKLTSTETNVAKIAYLRSKTGYTVGDPLWLQIKGSSGLPGRVLIDNVDVTFGSGAPPPDWATTAVDMHNNPSSYTATEFEDIANEIITATDILYGGAQWESAFSTVEPILIDLAIAPTNPIITYATADLNWVSAALVTWEGAVLNKVPMDQLFAHRGAFPVGATAPRISTNEFINVWATNAHNTILIDTGLYAAPGETVELIVPPEIYNSEMTAMVGHEVKADKEWSNDQLYHMPYPYRVFSLSSPTTTVGSVQGGLIMFQAPWQVQGLTNVAVTIDGAVEAPIFIAGETTNEEWENIRDRETYWGVIQAASPGSLGGINLIFRSAMLRKIPDMELFVQEYKNQMTFEEEFYAASPTRPFRIHADYHGVRGYSTFPQYKNPDIDDHTDLMAFMRNGDAMTYHEYGHILDGQNSQQFWNGWTETQNNWAGMVMSTLTNQFGFTYKSDMHAQMRTRQFEDYLLSGEAINFMDSAERYLQFVKQDMQAAFSDHLGWENCKAVIAYIRALPVEDKDEGQERQDLWLTRLAMETGYDITPFVEPWQWTNSAAAKSTVGAYPEFCPMEELAMKMVVEKNGSSTITNLADLGFSYEGTVTFVSVGTPSHGSITDHGDGSFTYTPAADYTGKDSIPYTLENGVGNSFTRTIPVAVLAATDFPTLEAGETYAGTEGWTTVDLDHDFGSDMVVVAMPVIPDGSPAVVSRVRNASGTSFDLKVQRTDGATRAVAGVNVQYMVARQGTYDPDTHGVRMKVGTYLSTTTDSAANWSSEPNILYPFTSYTNSAHRGEFFRAPRVFGQVMSYNDSRWSTFWVADGDNQKSPAITAAEGLRMGKHVGHDAETTRNAETIGYIIFEGGRTPNYQFGDLRLKLGDTMNSYRHEGRFPLTGSTQYEVRRMPPIKAMVLQAGGITDPVEKQTGYWTTLEGTLGNLFSNNTFNAKIISDSGSDNGLYSANAAFVAFSGSAVHLSSGPPPPQAAGLFDPALMNSGFEDPVLTNGATANGMKEWYDSKVYTYTSNDGASSHPDTPYGDNWAELGYGRWIYQQIGTYKKNMELEVSFLLGRRTDIVGLESQVSLWVGGSPALASDVNIKYPNPLENTVGASLITNSAAIPALGTPGAMEEKSFTLSTGTGFTVGDPLWLQIYVISTTAGRVLIDNVQVVDPNAGTYTLTYSAGAGGSISGAALQFVDEGMDATAVTAVPDTDYGFEKWSDNRTDNPRIDSNVTADITVAASFSLLDTDGDGTTNDIDEDDDGDGIPDVWENENALDPLVANQDEDPDMDGFTNYFEYITDTLPTDGNSKQRFAIEMESSGLGVQTTFNTSSNRYYVVEYRDDMTSGSWTNLGSPFAGTGAETNILDTSIGDARFYRLRIHLNSLTTTVLNLYSFSNTDRSSPGNDGPYPSKGWISTDGGVTTNATAVYDVSTFIPDNVGSPQTLAYTVTGLDLDNIGGANDSIVISFTISTDGQNIQTVWNGIEPKNAGWLSSGTDVLNANGEYVQFDKASLSVNLNGETNNGIGSFDGFSHIRFGSFTLSSEVATANGIAIAQPDGTEIDLTPDGLDSNLKVIFDTALGAVGAWRPESWSFQITIQ